MTHRVVWSVVASQVGFHSDQAIGRPRSSAVVTTAPGRLGAKSKDRTVCSSVSLRPVTTGIWTAEVSRNSSAKPRALLVKSVAIVSGAAGAKTGNLASHEEDRLAYDRRVVNDEPVRHEHQEAVGQSVERVQREPRNCPAPESDDRAYRPLFIGQQKRAGGEPDDDDYRRGYERYEENRPRCPEKEALLVAVADPVDETVADPRQVEGEGGECGCADAEEDQHCIGVVSTAELDGRPQRSRQRSSSPEPTHGEGDWSRHRNGDEHHRPRGPCGDAHRCLERVIGLLQGMTDELARRERHENPQDDRREDQSV